MFSIKKKKIRNNLYTLFKHKRIVVICMFIRIYYAYNPFKKKKMIIF